MKITFISDTHSKHHQITKDLDGGDLLIHAGDISTMGYKHE
jgi:predicted phosphodiesterase